MTQLTFRFPLRYEQAAAHWSYVDAEGQRVFRKMGAHSIDLSWPWWEPIKLSERHNDWHKEGSAPALVA